MVLSYASSALSLFALLCCFYFLRSNKETLTKLKTVKTVLNAKDELRSNDWKPQYNMTMGLRPSRGKRWIDTDEDWLAEHKARRNILDEPKNSVIQCLPGSELACEEVMALVVDDLIIREPKRFRRYTDSQVDRIEIVDTGETFIIASPFGRLRPLEIAARLAMEDFNILEMGKDGQHRLYVIMAKAKDYPESTVEV